MKIEKRYCCTNCGSSNIEVRAWVKPYKDNEFSTYYEESLASAESVYCCDCGEWTKLVKKETEIDTDHLWRCEECGSLNIEQKVWVDSNSGKQTSQDGVERNECWCNDCQEHTGQVQENTLMETINDWFFNHPCPVDPQLITGIKRDDFASDDECKQAHSAYWDALPNEEKISIWESFTCEKS